MTIFYHQIPFIRFLQQPFSINPSLDITKIVLIQNYNMPLTPHRPSQTNNFFDFCQQCSCFHQAYYQNGLLVMFPCQSSITQPNIDEKITSDTNITLPTINESINSFSSMSIKNHLSPTVRPKSIRQNKQVRNVYGVQEGFVRPYVYSSKSPQVSDGSKSPQRPTSIRSKQSSTHSITLNKYQTNSSNQQVKSQQQKPFSFYNQTKSITLVQNNHTSPIISPTIISAATKTYSAQKPLNKISTTTIPTSFNHPSLQTPQFGSQSRISQNKQNTGSFRRFVLKQQKQFIIPKITQGRQQRAISELQTDTFCCGYIKKG